MILGANLALFNYRLICYHFFLRRLNLILIILDSIKAYYIFIANFSLLKKLANNLEKYKNPM